MKLRTLLFLFFVFSTYALSQVQQQQPQTKYSVDDVMKKLEVIDNSFKEKVDALRGEFDQKLNTNIEKVREEFNSRLDKIDSKVSDASDVLMKRIGQIEAQNRDVRNRISKVEEKVSGIESGISDVKNSIAGVNSSVKEVSEKVDANTSKFDEIISRISSSRSVVIIGFVIVIILVSVATVGLYNLSKTTKSVEKNIIDSFEHSVGKLEVSASDLKTVVDVLKQQTSEIVAYQRILEERIISAQQQIEAKLEEKLAVRRRTQRKSQSGEAG